MAYAKLSTGYWHDSNGLGADARLMGLYGRRWPERNGLGCFVLRRGYAAPQTRGARGGRRVVAG